MADDDDVLNKADALMQRRRVFIAGAQSEALVTAADDDVPVLTEVVSTDSIAAPEAPPAPAPVDLDDLRNALALELEAWLDQELPQHVMHVLDGITDQLIIQLALRARAELLPRLQARLGAAMPDAAAPAEPEK